MSIIGAPRAWVDVIEDQAPRLLKLVAAVWKRIPVGAADEREDAITNRLVAGLQRSKAARRLMFYILPQVVEIDPSCGKEFGRMDIAFYPTGIHGVPREDVYFCVECKRLNVPVGGTKRGYSSEYVTLGMARFVSGQYSRSVRHGGMVGYVRDGQVADAMSQVERNIKRRRAKLCMDVPGEFVASAVFPRLPHARETHHRRAGERVPFRLHHLFLAGDPSTVMSTTDTGTGGTRKKKKKWPWRRRR